MSSPSTSTVYRPVIVRQQREHARRVAARRRRLADREADLALRHREARDRVHHQHHVAPLVAEVLGDRGCRERRLDPHERRLVGRRHDDHRALHAVRPEVALHELAHLAPALADQADHVDLRRRRSGDHPEQRRLADAGAREDAEPLAAAAGDERVERPYAERHALVDARALERVGRRRLRGAHPSPVLAADRPEPVDRAAEPIQRAAEQPIGHLDGERAPARGHARPGPDAGRVAQRHQQRPARAEADDLGGHGGAAAPGLDRAHLADLGLQPGGLDDQADQVAHPPVPPVEVGVADRGRRRVERADHLLTGSCRAPRRRPRARAAA